MRISCPAITHMQWCFLLAYSDISHSKDVVVTGIPMFTRFGISNILGNSKHLYVYVSQPQLLIVYKGAPPPASPAH